MDYRDSGTHKCARWLATGIVLLSLLVTSGVEAAKPKIVRIAAPYKNATLSGIVEIATTVNSAAAWVNFYIDGQYLRSGPPYATSWDSTSVGNGPHAISVAAFATGGAHLGSARVRVKIKNTLN